MNRATFVLMAILVCSATADAQTGTAVSHRRLEQSITVSGVDCAATGKAHAGFFADGRLESCPIARDTTIGGHTLPTGTWIYLTQTGVLRRAWLRRDTLLQGHRCKGTGYKGWSVEFHPSARLSMCYLASEQLVDGVPCRAGSFWGEVTGGVKTWFHENGKLRSCSLASAHTHTGARYEARTRIELDPSGVLIPRAPTRVSP